MGAPRGRPSPVHSSQRSAPEPESPGRAAPRASFRDRPAPDGPGRAEAAFAQLGPEGRRIGRGTGRAGPGRRPAYLRMLCASMLRFWLLEQTTATRSGDDGMAVASPSAPSRSGLPPRRGSSARARWRPRLPEVMTPSGGADDVPRRDARRGRIHGAPQASPRGLKPGSGRREAHQRAPGWRARLCSEGAQPRPAFLTGTAHRPRRRADVTRPRRRRRE